MAAHQLYFCFSCYTHTEIYLQASSQLKEAFGWDMDSRMWAEVMAEFSSLIPTSQSPHAPSFLFFLLLENLRCLMLKRVASEDGRGLIHKTRIRAWKRTTWHTLGMMWMGKILSQCWATEIWGLFVIVVNLMTNIETGSLKWDAATTNISNIQYIRQRNRYSRLLIYIVQ